MAKESKTVLKSTRAKIVPQDLPTKLDTYVPDSALFSQLLSFEKRLDATIARKHIDIAESLQAPTRLRQLLRLYIFNEYHNQDPLFATEPASWTLKIQGHLIDPDTSQPARSSPWQFSNFVSRVVVHLDPREFPGSEGVAEWRKSTSGSVVDGFEIKRIGSKDVAVKITLFLDHSPPKYKVSAALGRILPAKGEFTDTKHTIIAKLAEYIKFHKLQADSHSPIVFDKEMASVLGVSSCQLSELLQHVRPHLSAADPFEFKYTVRVSGDPQQKAQTYEIGVDAPQTYVPPTVPMPGQPPIVSKELQALNDKVQELLKDVHVANRKREFLLGFAESPVDGLNALIAAQAREVKALTTYARDAEAEKRATYYQQNWVPDAIDRYLGPITQPPLLPDFAGTPDFLSDIPRKSSARSTSTTAQQRTHSAANLLPVAPHQQAAVAAQPRLASLSRAGTSLNPAGFNLQQQHPQQFQQQLFNQNQAQSQQFQAAPRVFTNISGPSPMSHSNLNQQFASRMALGVPMNQQIPQQQFQQHPNFQSTMQFQPNFQQQQQQLRQQQFQQFPPQQLTGQFVQQQPQSGNPNLSQNQPMDLDNR